MWEPYVVKFFRQQQQQLYPVGCCISCGGRGGNEVEDWADWVL